MNLYEGIKEYDYQTMRSATNLAGQPYRIVELPLTKRNVAGLDYKGSYLNFYVGNEVLLTPAYDDETAQKTLETLGKLYTNKRIVPINVAPLYKNGGMIHCHFAPAGGVMVKVLCLLVAPFVSCKRDFTTPKCTASN